MCVVFPSQLFAGVWKKEIWATPHVVPVQQIHWGLCCHPDTPSLALENLTNVILCVLHWKP